MNKLNIVLYIVLSGAIGWWLLWSSDVRELNTSVIYDGCYEQYTYNDIQPEEFTKFMTNCMK